MKSTILFKSLGHLSKGHLLKPLLFFQISFALFCIDLEESIMPQKHLNNYFESMQMRLCIEGNSGLYICRSKSKFFIFSLH